MKLKDKHGYLLKITAINVNDEFDVAFNVLEGYNMDVTDDGIFVLHNRSVFDCVNEIKKFAIHSSDYISITYQIERTVPKKDKVLFNKGLLYTFTGKEFIFSDNPIIFNEYELNDENGNLLGEYIYSRK